MSFVDLYLIRHGIAIEREEPDCPPEAERYLTKEGLLRTRQAMKGLAALDIEPEEIWTSPYLRASQTAQIAAEELGQGRKRLHATEALLPSADPARLFRELQKHDVGSVACCGHAPHLDETIAHATGAREAFTQLKKAGVACLAIDPAKPGRGTLLWLLTAKQLRGLEK
jgi:phosphohistidine phosphatase